MHGLDLELHAALTSLRQAGLERQLRRADSPQGTELVLEGRRVLNFGSNDYLGLANHPAVKQAAIQAVTDFGAGAGAARLLCGSMAPHHQLEEALAAFKGTEAALTFSSGYATALGCIPALVGRGDVVILDKLAHACLVDAARLSGATLRVFAHNDLEDLEAKLRWATAGSGTHRARPSAPSPQLDDPSGAEAGLGPHVAAKRPRVLVVTESIFSMDGDAAPLRELVELKDRYGAWLLVDEAHATGLYGPQGSGLAQAFGVAERIEVHMGTLSKALGAAGGYIAGSKVLIQYLVNRARSFMFSTAPMPAAAAAARAALQLVQSEEGQRRRTQLWARVSQIRSCLAKLGWPLAEQASPILPLRVGSEQRAVELAAALWARGIYVPAIRYPTVARGQARLRLSVSAAHTGADLEQLDRALTALGGPDSNLSDASAG